MSLRIVFITGLMGIGLWANIANAQDPTPSSQALDQLRFLQQKLSKETSSITHGIGQALPPDQVQKSSRRARIHSRPAPHSNSDISSEANAAPLAPPLHLPGTEDEDKIIDNSIR